MLPAAVSSVAKLEAEDRYEPMGLLFGKFRFENVYQEYCSKSLSRSTWGTLSGRTIFKWSPIAFIWVKNRQISSSRRNPIHLSCCNTPPLSGPSVASMLSVRQQNAAPCRIRDIVLTSGPGTWTPEALNLIECETFQSSLNFRSILMIMIKVNGSPPSLGMVFWRIGEDPNDPEREY